MDEFVKIFYIDYKLIAAQVFNFAIVIFVLYKFAYKPLLKNMNERTEIIEKGLEDAKKAGESLEKAQEIKEAELDMAKKDAKRIIEEAKQVAEKSKNEILNEARVAAEGFLTKAEKQISAEKDAMLKDLKEELGGLVLMATEKVLDAKMDKTEDADFIKKVVRNIKSN